MGSTDAHAAAGAAPDDFLARAATQPALDDLRGAGFLAAREHGRALRLAAEVPLLASWRRFLVAGGGTVGMALVVAGVIFFIAANWGGLSHLARLLLVVGGMGVATAAGMAAGPDRLAGRLGFTAAAILVGPLLALLGQMYPSGAPSWTLFALWTGLALPWVAAARWAPAWLAEIALADAALVFAASDRWGDDVRTGLWGALLVAGFNAVVFVVWRALQRRQPWMAGSWPCRVLAIGVVAPLTLGLSAWLGAGEADMYVPAFAVSLAFVAAVVGLTILDVDLPQRDPFLPAVAAAGAMLVVTMIIVRLVIIEAHAEILGSFVAGSALLVMAGAAARWLGGIAAESAPTDYAARPDAPPQDTRASWAALLRRPSLAEVLTHALDPERSIADIGGAVAGETSPWFVRALAAVAAWLAALLFLVALEVLPGPEDVLAAVGAVLACAAVALVWLTRDWNKALGRATLADQLALAGTLLARLLIFIGVDSLVPDDAVAFAVLLFVEVGLFAATPDAMQRGIAAACAGLWLALVALEYDSLAGQELVLVFLTAAAGLAVLRPWAWSGGPLWAAARSATYGVPAGAAAATLALMLVATFQHQEPLRLWASVAVGLLVAAACWQFAAEAGAGPGARALAGVPVLVGAVTAGAPGIVLALGLIVAAFRMREPLLLGLAACFLVVFLGWFYYSLEMTLVEKSGLLAASGAVLVAAAGCVSWAASRQPARAAAP